MARIRKRGRRTIRMTLDIAGPTRPLGMEFDETGTAFYVRIRAGAAATTKSLGEEVMVDYDRRGRLLGFEVLGLTSGRRATLPDSIRSLHPDEVPAFELAVS